MEKENNLADAEAKAMGWHGGDAFGKVYRHRAGAAVKLRLSAELYPYLQRSLRWRRSGDDFVTELAEGNCRGAEVVPIGTDNLFMVEVDLEGDKPVRVWSEGGAFLFGA